MNRLYSWKLPLPENMLVQCIVVLFHTGTPAIKRDIGFDR